METENSLADKIIISVMDIIKGGGEAVVRKRSKNGEEYIEVVEQKFKVAEKCNVEKK